VIVRRAGTFVCASAVALSSLGLFDGEARATPLTVSLTYAAGPECPEAADFKAVVIARLGYDPFLEAAPDHVSVEVEPRGSGLSGRIEWRDSSGKWTGDQSFPSVSADCQRLVRVMGFALAVEIQFLAKANAAPPGSDAAPSPPPSSATTVKKPVPTAGPPPVASTSSAAANLSPSSTDRPRPVLAVGAGPSVGIGMSSTPVLLGRLLGALAWPHVSFELAAVADLPTTTRRADGAGFSQQHLFGSAAACGLVTRWSACLMANAGVVRMAGENIDRTNSASLPIAQAGVRAGVNQALGGRARLGAHVDGLVNLTRWTGSLDQVPVWTAPRFATTIGLDAGVLFA
jgi:hypothetical protein